jgi:hypothetical protein
MVRVALAVAAVLATTAPAAVGATPFCRAGDLTGTFAAVPGSAGAGSVSYMLRLQNRSTRACALTGIPIVGLLGRTGRPLPTRQAAAHPGTGTAVLVTLDPGRRAQATARFSPDVPGPGESGTSACEPTAFRLRVAPNGGGTLTVPVVPPTPVCEHGRLLLSNLSLLR